jgi:protein-disulfide isomerase-like protein with CxxC motif
LEVKVIFFPVHKTAEGKIITGICRGMTFEDYLAGKYGKESCSKGKENLRKSQEIARKLGVSGTPTVILDDGKRVIGVNFRLLEKYLDRR